MKIDFLQLYTKNYLNRFFHSPNKINVIITTRSKIIIIDHNMYSYLNMVSCVDNFTTHVSTM